MGMLKAAMVHKGGSNMEAVSYCVVYTVKSGQRDAFVQRRPPYADGKLGQ